MSVADITVLDEQVQVAGAKVVEAQAALDGKRELVIRKKSLTVNLAALQLLNKVLSEGFNVLLKNDSVNYTEDDFEKEIRESLELESVPYDEIERVLTYLKVKKGFFNYDDTKSGSSDDLGEVTLNREKFSRHIENIKTGLAQASRELADLERNLAEAESLLQQAQKELKEAEGKKKHDELKAKIEDGSLSIDSCMDLLSATDTELTPDQKKLLINRVIRLSYEAGSFDNIVQLLTSSAIRLTDEEQNRLLKTLFYSSRDIRLAQSVPQAKELLRQKNVAISQLLKVKFDEGDTLFLAEVLLLSHETGHHPYLRYNLRRVAKRWPKIDVDGDWLRKTMESITVRDPNSLRKLVVLTMVAPKDWSKAFNLIKDDQLKALLQSPTKENFVAAFGQNQESIYTFMWLLPFMNGSNPDSVGFGKHFTMEEWRSVWQGVNEVTTAESGDSCGLETYIRHQFGGVDGAINFNSLARNLPPAALSALLLPVIDASVSDTAAAMGGRLWRSVVGGTPVRLQFTGKLMGLFGEQLTSELANHLLSDPESIRALLTKVERGDALHSRKNRIIAVLLKAEPKKAAQDIINHGTKEIFDAIIGGISELQVGGDLRGFIVALAEEIFLTQNIYEDDNNRQILLATVLGNFHQYFNQRELTRYMSALSLEYRDALILNMRDGVNAMFIGYELPIMQAADSVDLGNLKNIGDDDFSEEEAKEIKEILLRLRGEVFIVDYELANYIKSALLSHKFLQHAALTQDDCAELISFIMQPQFANQFTEFVKTISEGSNEILRNAVLSVIKDQLLSRTSVLDSNLRLAIALNPWLVLQLHEDKSKDYVEILLRWLASDEEVLEKFTDRYRQIGDKTYVDLIEATAAQAFKNHPWLRILFLKSKPRLLLLSNMGFVARMSVDELKDLIEGLSDDDAEELVGDIGAVYGGDDWKKYVDKMTQALLAMGGNTESWIRGIPAAVRRFLLLDVKYVEQIIKYQTKEAATRNLQILYMKLSDQDKVSFLSELENKLQKLPSDSPYVQAIVTMLTSERAAADRAVPTQGSRAERPILHNVAEVRKQFLKQPNLFERILQTEEGNDYLLTFLKEMNDEDFFAMSKLPHLHQFMIDNFDQLASDEKRVKLIYGVARHGSADAKENLSEKIKLWVKEDDNLKKMCAILFGDSKYYSLVQRFFSDLIVQAALDDDSIREKLLGLDENYIDKIFKQASGEVFIDFAKQAFRSVWGTIPLRKKIADALFGRIASAGTKVRPGSSEGQERTDEEQNIQELIFNLKREGDIEAQENPFCELGEFRNSLFEHVSDARLGMAVEASIRHGDHLCRAFFGLNKKNQRKLLKSIVDIESAMSAEVDDDMHKVVLHSIGMSHRLLPPALRVLTAKDYLDCIPSECSSEKAQDTRAALTLVAMQQYKTQDAFHDAIVNKEFNPEVYLTKERIIEMHNHGKKHGNSSAVNAILRERLSGKIKAELPEGAALYASLIKRDLRTGTTYFTDNFDHYSTVFLGRMRAMLAERTGWYKRKIKSGDEASRRPPAEMGDLSEQEHREMTHLDPDESTYADLKNQMGGGRSEPDLGGGVRHDQEVSTDDGAPSLDDGAPDELEDDDSFRFPR